MGHWANTALTSIAGWARCRCYQSMAHGVLHHAPSVACCVVSCVLWVACRIVCCIDSGLWPTSHCGTADGTIRSLQARPLRGCTRRAHTYPSKPRQTIPSDGSACIHGRRTAQWKREKRGCPQQSLLQCLAFGGFLPKNCFGSGREYT